MRRPLSLIALVAMLVAAFVSYRVKYDTRRIDERVRNLEQQVDAARAEIAVLEAERANLARPDRIEALAVRHLPLQPMTPEQFGAIGDIPWREEVAAKPVAESAPPATASPVPTTAIEAVPPEE